MSRVCEFTGKRPASGNRVSHANNKKRRRFLPNLHTQRFWLEGEQRWVSLRVSANAMRTIEKNGLDAVVCIGCLIKGDTMHFEYICEGVTQGIMRLNADTETPVIFGVLAVLDESQARARAGLEPGSHNHGEEWAHSAIKMALMRRKLLAIF